MDIDFNMKDYTVAIRTLGTAGEKYQKLLDSIKAQTVLPKDVFVYIPYGYELPKETAGIEKYVRCEKGMITQRSLPFEEIITPYVLFCDDDIQLKPTTVEAMIQGMESNTCDCMAVSIFNDTHTSLTHKLSNFIHSFITPRRNDGWDVKIKRNASYSYNTNPTGRFLPTESAPGGCCMLKMYVYRRIHFEDERWLEKMKYPAGEDQLFYYKMHIMGFKVFMFNNSGVIHLDAKAGKRVARKDKMLLQKKNIFILWYRTIFDIRSKGFWERLRCCFAFGWRCLFGMFTLPLELVYYRQPRFLIDYFRGLWAGYKYIKSDEYQQLPPYDAYIDYNVNINKQ